MKWPTGLDTIEAIAYERIARGAKLEAWPDWQSLQRRGRSGYRRLIIDDISGRCEKPSKVELYGKQWYRRRGERKRNPMTIILDVKCRRCGWCLKTRSSEWASRALEEFAAAPRTWMGTITLSPESHATVYARTIRGLYIRRKDGSLKCQRPAVPDFATQPAEVQFAELVRTIGLDLTLFLKRVRKNSQAPFRYLLVAERHKSGLPHFHMLVHETSEDRPIRKSVLKEAWDLGFTKFSLVDTSGGAVYVCKYMAKDALNRVRASFKYGNPPSREPSNFRCEETKGFREKEGSKEVLLASETA